MANTVAISRGILAFGTFLASQVYDFGASLYHRQGTSDPPSKNGRTELAELDRITDLPGLVETPNFQQFSGYVNASDTRHIFYWYVESQSNPDEDPVVLWTNGGPGCSGLLGFGTEHGPFILDRDGRLHRSRYSWNRVATMVVPSFSSIGGICSSGSRVGVVARWKTGGELGCFHRIEFVSR
jgi:hypothetical protein